MRFLALSIVLLVMFCRAAFAADGDPTLDGEIFSKRFDGAPPNGDKLIEFVRDSEAFDSWTKLIAYRYQQLPHLGNDPVKYASVLGQSVRQANSQAPVKVAQDESSGDAILDFLTWTSDQKHMELNVWRFWKSSDGKAVVSLQFASKFPSPKRPELTPESMAEFQRALQAVRERRFAFLKQAASSNTKLVEAALGAF